MVSFQQDFLLTIYQFHGNYLNKINDIFDNDDLLKNLSINDAEKLIEYVKEYKHLIYSICLVIDKINNVKNYNSINTKIENELMLKIIPIMNVYRLLLFEKYNKSNLKTSNINDQD